MALSSRYPQLLCILTGLFTETPLIRIVNLAQRHA
jgi:hypothetical protein